MDNYPSRACGLAPTACFGVEPSIGLKTEKHKLTLNTRAGRDALNYIYIKPNLWTVVNVKYNVI